MRGPGCDRFPAQTSRLIQTGIEKKEEQVGELTGEFSRRTAGWIGASKGTPDKGGIGVEGVIGRERGFGHERGRRVSSGPPRGGVVVDHKKEWRRSSSDSTVTSVAAMVQL